MLNSCHLASFVRFFSKFTIVLWNVSDSHQNNRINVFKNKVQSLLIVTVSDIPTFTCQIWKQNEIHNFFYVCQKRFSTIMYAVELLFFILIQVSERHYIHVIIYKNVVINGMYLCSTRYSTCCPPYQLIIKGLLQANAICLQLF